MLTFSKNMITIHNRYGNIKTPGRNSIGAGIVDIGGGWRPLRSLDEVMKKYYRCDNGYVEHPEWVPYCWVNIEQPDDGDVKFMIDDLGVPSDFVDSIADPDERCRIERDGNWKMTILRVPKASRSDDAPYTTVPLGIITNNEVILTLCYHKTEQMDDFVNYTRRRGIRITREEDFVLRIIYSTVYWFLRYLRNIGKAVSAAHQKVSDGIRNEDLIKLQELQTTLVYFSTSLEGNTMLNERLLHVYGDDYDKDLYEDVNIELHQATATTSIYTDILESLQDSFASIISNNVNDVMKKMTAVSIVLMFPTLVASFYGMNVTISYGSYPYLFWIIVGGSLLISCLLFVLLKKFRWL